MSATNGKPVSGINVFVRGKSATSDASGRFVLDRAPVGKATVMFSAKDSIPSGFEQRSYIAKPGELVDMGTIKIVPPRTGEPGTLGFLVEVRSGTLVVTNVQTDGPAANNGIKAGAAIISIDGQPVAEVGLEVSKRLLAPGVVAAGEVVVLGLDHAVSKITAARWE